MQVWRNVLIGLVAVALLCGVFLFAERLTVQELTRVENSGTQEALCLMWKPRLLRGDGFCDLDLVSAQGKVLDTARLGKLDTGINALQQYGQLEFQGDAVKVMNTRTGELMQRFTVRDSRLVRAE